MQMIQMILIVLSPPYAHLTPIDREMRTDPLLFHSLASVTRIILVGEGFSCSAMMCLTHPLL